MKKVLFLLIALFLHAGFAFSSHFSKNWTGNGYNQMNFNAISALVNGEPLQAGDEIAVFDGANCVGFNEVLIPTVSGNIVYIIASADDPNSSALDGFISNHPVTIKIWDQSRGVEIDNIAILNPFGPQIFTPGESLWMNLVGTWTCTPPAAPSVNVVNNCDGTSTLTALDYVGTLVWSTGETAESIIVSVTGEYWVTQTVNECTSLKATAIATPRGEVVSVSISASETTVCPGTQVSFTAIPVNGGTNPSYVWNVNGFPTDSRPTFIYAPIDGDKITCTIWSDAPCVIAPEATSDPIIMEVTPGLLVGVAISASANTICPGQSVTFTATPANGGNNPQYYWYVGNTQLGSSVQFVHYPQNGDVVTCKIYSDAECVENTEREATSDPITITVTPGLEVGVSIEASSTTVCPGQSVTFTATPANGGSNPQYYWYVGNTQLGSSVQFVYYPQNGDVVTCKIYSDAECVENTERYATSNEITMTVTSNLPVSVSIAAVPSGAICSGTSVAFTATPVNLGTTPVYQWIVNGNNVGTNSASYSYTPANADVVTCMLTSSETCATGNPATSDPISMSVTSNLQVSVSIAAVPSGAICSGTSVTFTATPVNPGTTPVYQWIVNGNNVGTNSESYSYTPANADAVTCMLTSSETCATGNPATSDPISMSVTSMPLAPTINVVNNCDGTSTLTASGYTGTLLWSTTETNASITVSIAGTYTVTQTVNGCTSLAGSGTAAPKTAPLAPAVNVVNNCNGTSTLTASGYTGTLLWSNGETTESITVSVAGSYTVTQTVDGCLSEAGSGTAVVTACTNALNLSVFLEGPFSGSSMTTQLNTNSWIQLTQPYSGTPWNYTGTEQVSEIPTGVVDWVLIELRLAVSPDLATSETILNKRAAFVKSNGSVVDLDGSSPVSFDNLNVTAGNNLYVVIRHRNHLAIMSANAAVLTGGVYNYDFTTGINQTYGGENGFKQVGSAFVMVAGDIYQDGAIWVDDYNDWAAEFGATDGYFKSDLDMDGQSYTPDFNNWAINFASEVDDLLKSAKLQSKYISGVPK
ncbi:MAG: hypothetical protein K0M40_08795 [Prolixibacteraceae bacterium]|nr:hypothetical protein [Prolixibacteraceae bacterium]